MRINDHPFVGSEAIDAGLVTKYELRRKFTPVFPDVYLHPDVEPTLDHRARAAWLWSHREGVIAGLTASGLHGAKWVDDSLPIELIWPNARPAKGIRTYDYTLAGDEFFQLDGMRVTTLTRTAFDVGRRRGRLEAVTRLDALGNAARFRVDDVAALAARHRCARNVRRLGVALDLHDRGAESPKETWLRMMLIDEGFPRPQTQIAVPGPDGQPLYFLDMGWEDLKVAVEYDGEHHRTDRPSFAKDVIRLEYIASLRWLVIRVLAEHRRDDIVRRVRDARASRLLSDREIS
jgi:very-short-patch-repair endonuclease